MKVKSSSGYPPLYFTCMIFIYANSYVNFANFDYITCMSIKILLSKRKGGINEPTVEFLSLSNFISMAMVNKGCSSCWDALALWWGAGPPLLL